MLRCRGDRYDGVRVCLGDELLEKLASLKLFMVGSVLVSEKGVEGVGL